MQIFFEFVKNQIRNKFSSVIVKKKLKKIVLFWKKIIYNSVFKKKFPYIIWKWKNASSCWLDRKRKTPECKIFLMVYLILCTITVSFIIYIYIYLALILFVNGFLIIRTCKHEQNFFIFLKINLKFYILQCNFSAFSSYSGIDAIKFLFVSKVEIFN